MAGFTTPDDDVAFSTLQSQLFAADFFALAQFSQGSGVLSGLAVTQKGAGANMSVDVAAGTAVTTASSKLTTGGVTNVPITAADATNPRLDVIVMPTGGTPTVRTGTAATALLVKPVTPSAGDVVLAFVYVPANAASITTANNITDKRFFLAQAFPSLYRARAHRSVAQSIPNAVATVVIFDVEDYDLNSNFNNATGVYTAPVTGYYDIRGTIQFDGLVAAGSGLIVIILINGAEKMRIEKYVEANAGNYISIPFADIFAVTAGQTISVQAYQAGGGAKNIGGDTPTTDCVLAINCVGL